MLSDISCLDHDELACFVSMQVHSTDCNLSIHSITISGSQLWMWHTPVHEIFSASVFRKASFAIPLAEPLRVLHHRWRALPCFQH